MENKEKKRTESQSEIEETRPEADEREAEKKKRQRRTRRAFLSLLIKLCAIGILGYLLLTYVLGIYLVHSNQMYPSIRDGDLCVTYRRSHYLYDEVISYSRGGTRYFGRIVGVSGDVIDMDAEGHYTVNGSIPLETVYYVTAAAENGVSFPCTVSEGCVFVLNDMREQTRDSREFGEIPLEEADGSVVFMMRRRGW